jgi:hypothetical protein
MPTLSWTLNVDVQGGPKLGVAQAVTIDGYDNTVVIVPGGKTNTVDIQPGTVKFLAVLADRYDGKLSYKTSTTGSPITVDAPQIFTGAAVGLLGLTGTPPALIFSNSDATKQVTIQVLAGRTTP